MMLTAAPFVDVAVSDSYVDVAEEITFLAEDPDGFSGFDNRSVLDPRLKPDEFPILDYILASTNDFENDGEASASDPRLEPDERPIISYILASTDEFDSNSKASATDPRLEPDEIPIMSYILASTDDFEDDARGRLPWTVAEDIEKDVFPCGARNHSAWPEIGTTDGRMTWGAVSDSEYPTTAEAGFLWIIAQVEHPSGAN